MINLAQTWSVPLCKWDNVCPYQRLRYIYRLRLLCISKCVSVCVCVCCVCVWIDLCMCVYVVYNMNERGGPWSKFYELSPFDND